jgi:hypothetical protein
LGSNRRAKKHPDTKQERSKEGVETQRLAHSHRQNNVVSLRWWGAPRKTRRPFDFEWLKGQFSVATLSVHALATISFARDARPAYDAAILWFSSRDAFDA